MSQRSFGELELIILKTMHELKEATVRQVFDKIGGGGSYTTVMTVMSRLAKKKELKREKLGKHYLYQIDVQNAHTSTSMLHRIKDKIFGGKGAKIVSFLLENDEDISEEELSEIESFIQKRRNRK